MGRLITIFSLFFISSCVNFNPAIGDPSDELYYSGGDGSSYKEAIWFPSAKSSAQGIALERQWLAERFPGYERKGQRTVRHNQRIFDRMVIVTSSGDEKTLFFDMTNWYGFPGLDG